LYITCERFATMGAELSTLTVEKDKNPKFTNRYYVKNSDETVMVVYTNPPNETYSKPSSSFCFTNGDDLMFCLNALKHAGFHPYKSNGIGAGFSFIGEKGGKTKTFYNMPEMKDTLEPGEETCFWNPNPQTLKIPNKCLTFEEIENLFNEIKRDNTVLPVFTKSEEDFPVLPNSQTHSPVVEETPTSAPVENPTLDLDNVPGVDEEETRVSTDVSPLDSVNGMPMVFPTYIPVNGVMSEFNTITKKVMVYIGNDPVWLTLSHKNE